jgi:glutathione S-transferase
MKLYTATTPNGKKPLIALEELGVPYEIHWISFKDNEQKSPAFLAINPNGKIPALDDDGLLVWESGAILLHLAERYGQLIPRDRAGRMQVISQLFFQTGGIGPAGGRLGAEWRKPEDKRNQESFTYFRDEVERLLGATELVLQDGREYLAGEYSIADIMHFTWTDYLANAGIPGIGEHPFVKGWLDRVRARPAVQKALELKPG